MRAFLVVSLFFAFVVGDDAQALVATKSVCDTDVELFCPTEKTSSSCAQFKCLKDHLDFLTAPCVAYIKEKQLQKDSCKNATLTFCSAEENKWGIYRCLMAHVDQINGTCGEYIREKMAEYGKEVPLNACDNDATTTCSNATGFSSTLICIKQNWKNLSKDCRRLLWQLKQNYSHGFEKEHGRWHHRHGSEYGMMKNDQEERTRGPRDADSSSGNEEPKSKHERHERHEKHLDADSSSDNEEPKSKKHERHEKHSHRRHESSSRHEHERRSRRKEHSSKSAENKSKKVESKTKKSEKCLRKLKQACEKDLTIYCSNVTSEIREMKTCLMLNFAKLDKNCTEFLINPKSKSEQTPVADTPEVTIEPSSISNQQPDQKPAVQILENENNEQTEILDDDEE